MDILATKKASLTAGTGEVLPRGTDHRECSETYWGELLRLGRFRVAICREGRQWLYQRQRLNFASGGAAWDTLGYCTSRAALMRLHRSHSGTDGAVLAALPPHFTKGGRT